MLEIGSPCSRTACSANGGPRTIPLFAPQGEAVQEAPCPMTARSGDDASWSCARADNQTDALQSGRRQHGAAVGDVEDGAEDLSGGGGASRRRHKVRASGHASVGMVAAFAQSKPPCAWQLLCA